MSEESSLSLLRCPPQMSGAVPDPDDDPKWEQCRDNGKRCQRHRPLVSRLGLRRPRPDRLVEPADRSCSVAFVELGSADRVREKSQRRTGVPVGAVLQLRPSARGEDALAARTEANE